MTDMAPSSGTPSERMARRGVARIVLGYAGFAAAWILLSDRAAEALIPDPAAWTWVSMLKGWFFVAVTSLLLSLHLRRFVAKLAAREAEVRRQQEERQRTLLLLHGVSEASTDAIYVKDAEGRYLLFNQAAGRMVGREPQEVLGRDDRAVFPPGEADTLIAADRRIMEGSEVATLEERLTTPAGPRVFLATKGPLRGPDGTLVGLFGIARDITERIRAEEAHRRLESEIQHAQRLESLGRLASGVAHDMNNVLAAIQASAELLQSHQPESGPLARSLGLILMATGRGRDLVRGLTAFARKGLSEAPEDLDLNELVREEAALLERTLLMRVEVRVDLAPALPLVRGARSSLGNALMNLCVNAVDAMPEGGTLALRTAVIEGWVVVHIEDTGEGMPPEVLIRATEPFFTTKPVGKGTGLGLATVRGVVEAHGGHLDLDSEVGRGTRITLRLPSLGAGPGPDSGAGESGGLAAKHPSRHILLVDDDDLVRTALATLLVEGGHRVEVATDGAAAERQVADGQVPELVVLDLNMQGLDGPQTFERLRRLAPDLPVLIVSGFLEALPAGFAQDHARVRTLAKPFSLAQFQDCLRELGL